MHHIKIESDRPYNPNFFIQNPLEFWLKIVHGIDVRHGVTDVFIDDNGGVRVHSEEKNSYVSTAV